MYYVQCEQARKHELSLEASNQNEQIRMNSTLQLARIVSQCFVVTSDN